MAGWDAPISCKTVGELLARKGHRGYLIAAAVQELVDIVI
jgi:hypothetical protein